MFLISLFVLGGDFWDKLRSLFVRESRAVFPGDMGHGQETDGIMTPQKKV